MATYDLFIASLEVKGKEVLAMQIAGKWYRCDQIHHGLPKDIKQFLDKKEMYLPIAKIMHYAVLITARTTAKPIDPELVSNPHVLYEETFGE